MTTAEPATAAENTGGENIAGLTFARNVATIKAWEIASVDGEKGKARNLRAKNATTSVTSQLKTDSTVTNHVDMCNTFISLLGHIFN